MTQFGASFQFVELPAVAEFLASVGATGRLRMSWGAWVGEIVLRRGQMVATSMGDERGLRALESMAVGFLDGEFSFVHGPVAEHEPPLILAPQLAQEYLRRLNAERRAIREVIDSLSAVPRLVFEAGEIDSGEVTINPAALQRIPLLVNGDSVGEIARRRGLTRTLRDVVMLVRAGVVRLEAEREESAPEQSHNPLARVVPARVLAARAPQDKSTSTAISVRPTNTRPTRLLPRPYPRTDSIDPPNAPALQADAIEPPMLHAQSALTAPYVRSTLVQADAPRWAPLAGWSDALARILRRPQREHGRPPLLEPALPI